MAAYAMIILAGVIAALPNIFTAQQLASMPGWFPKRQVTLGLDLQGGSHLVLEVDAAALKTDRLRSLLDDARGALRKERINAQSASPGGGALVVNIADGRAARQALEVLQALAAPVGNLALGGSKADIEVTSDGDLIKVALTEAGLRDRLDAALQQSLEIVRQRVDQVGVAEPTIQRVGARPHARPASRPAGSDAPARTARQHRQDDASTWWPNVGRASARRLASR